MFAYFVSSLKIEGSGRNALPRTNRVVCINFVLFEFSLSLSGNVKNRKFALSEINIEINARI